MTGKIFKSGNVVLASGMYSRRAKVCLGPFDAVEIPAVMMSLNQICRFGA